MSEEDTSTDLSLVLRIDLYNFEEPQFESSKYVLTSPRSLEACSNLSVKPADLLYKPLAEFQEELLPQDIPLRTIYNIYDEHEQNRQKKLHLCRDERRKIIEQGSDALTKKSSMKLVKPSVSISKASALGPGGSNATSGSLQRKRTAWTSSIGHKRVTPQELDKRAHDLHEESQKLRRELLSKKDRNQSGTRSRGKSSARRRKPVSARSSHLADSYRYPPSTHLVRSSSISSLVTVADIPSRDKKILELMHSRREFERLESERIQAAHMAWDVERKHEEAAKVAAEMERRRLLVEINRIKDLRQEENEENLKHRMNSKQEGELERTALRKAMAVHEESMRALLKNKQEREAFEARRKFVENLNDRELDYLRVSVEEKLSKAAKNHSRMLHARNHGIFISRSENLKKQQKARKSVELRERQLESWRDSVVCYRKKMEEQASQRALLTMQQKARRAQEERLQREIEHSQNIKKLQEEDAAKFLETRNSIEKKEHRIRSAQELKDKTYLQSRAVAQTTEMLRDEIRSQYDSKTFDKMALQAELYARLDRMGLFDNMPSQVKEG